MPDAEAAKSDSWKQEVPYKLASGDTAFDRKYTASCFCGEVQYAVDADPVSAKFCHCTDCQRLHGQCCHSQFWAALTSDLNVDHNLTSCQAAAHFSFVYRSTVPVGCALP